MHDPLDDLLCPTPSVPDERFQMELFSRTTSSLRARRRWRLVGRVAVPAAVFVAGLLTVLAVTPVQEPGPQDSAVVSLDPPAPPEPTTPVALEWRALERPEDAARYYLAAGDGYLQEGDPDNATRCYANHLDEGGAPALEANTTDTWLLMAIKQARLKER